VRARRTPPAVGAIAALLVVVIALALPGCGGGGAGGTGDGSAEKPGNTLSWTAGEEAGVHGYLIYRAVDRSGPFRRVNDEIVRVPYDGVNPHTYSFRDEQVEPGVTYFYYLDVVSDAGKKQRFSGIISKTTPETPGS
jgi:hypothetical protein